MSNARKDPHRSVVRRLQQELAARYPDADVRVRKSRLPGKDIDVCWTGGPLEPAMERAILSLVDATIGPYRCPPRPNVALRRKPGPLDRVAVVAANVRNGLVPHEWAVAQLEGHVIALEHDLRSAVGRQPLPPSEREALDLAAALRQEVVALLQAIQPVEAAIAVLKRQAQETARAADEALRQRR